MSHGGLVYKEQEEWPVGLPHLCVYILHWLQSSDSTGIWEQRTDSKVNEAVY